MYAMIRVKTVKGSRRAIPWAVGRDIPEQECSTVSGIAQGGSSQIVRARKQEFHRAHKLLNRAHTEPTGRPLAVATSLPRGEALTPARVFFGVLRVREKETP